MSLERLSLAQQIAQIDNVAPTDVDPEDGTNTDPDLDANSASRAHYFDVGLSSLRKLHESLSDPKYDGAKTSRKLMLDQSNDSESDSASDDAESGSHILETYPNETGVEREVDPHADAPTESKHGSDLSSLRKIREEDRKKGKAISRQISLWDSLLDARIRLQKSVMAGNRLPAVLQYGDDHQVDTALMKVLDEARLLSNEMFDYQERTDPSRFLRVSVEGAPKLILPWLAIAKNYAKIVMRCRNLNARSYHAHLVHTLNKWSSKIQAVAPSVLLPSNRNAFSKRSHAIESAPQLIDETLADHGKVLARTRIYRGKESRLGVSTTDGDGSREREIAEVFDDSDFYHQLLRDVIDAKGNGASGNDDWMVTQREKKAKKKVDTKASKGRKLRYEVHEKLQNFMVPVPTQGSWHEEQIDELFASLLGKGFESVVGREEEEERGLYSM